MAARPAGGAAAPAPALDEEAALASLFEYRISFDNLTGLLRLILSRLGKHEQRASEQQATVDKLVERLSELGRDGTGGADGQAEPAKTLDVDDEGPDSERFQSGDAGGAAASGEQVRDGAQRNPSAPRAVLERISEQQARVDSHDGRIASLERTVADQQREIERLREQLESRASTAAAALAPSPPTEPPTAGSGSSPLGKRRSLAGQPQPGPDASSLALQSLSDAVASLRERVEKLELAAEEQSDMNGKVHALRVDCDRMDGTVSGLASQLRSLHPQPQSSKGTPASSGAISTDDAARIRQLEATSERHSQAIADSSARMDSLAKEALALRETLTSLQTSVLQLQKDMRGKGAAEEVAANAAALARLQNQLDSIARNASQDRALLESVSQEGNKLRRESKDFQIRTDDSLQMLNRRLDDWRAELAREFVSAATLHEQIAGMGARVDKISHTVKKKVDGELKIFERDLQEYLGEQLQPLRDGRHGKFEHVKGAAGRVHFRCLTCDSVIQDVFGPGTQAHKVEVGGNPQDGSPWPGSPPLLAAPPQPAQIVSNQPVIVGDLVVHPGEPRDVFGADGQVYRGREEPRILGSLRPLTPRVTRSHRLAGPGLSAGSGAQLLTMPSGFEAARTVAAMSSRPKSAQPAPARRQG